MSLTFGSLFAGIGGIDLGLERAGMSCQWQVENNVFCQKVLAKHWPNVRRYEDVRDCGKHNLEPVDLIAGGFPCQPHSVAGKRRGATDDRNLWPEYRRIIAELRPHWVLAENVLGIRTTMLDQVLSDLDDLAYTTGTLIIPACAFNAPHRRERVFIVAHTKSNLRGTPGDDRPISPDGGNPLVAHAPQLFGDGSDDNRGGKPGQIPELGNCTKEARPFGSWWATEPDVGRVAHGIPNRVDRLKALGNAVVPQVAEWIGRQILETRRP